MTLVVVAIPIAFLIAIDGFAWVILSLTGVPLPEYYDKVFTYCQPASFGEVALMLWRVIRGD